MGLEAKVDAVENKVTFSGNLHLDSQTIQFRSPKWTWQADLNEIEAHADQDWLVLKKGKQIVRFSVGPKVKSWVTKIQNPPTVSDKLGIKMGMNVWKAGKFSADFLSALNERQPKWVRNLGTCQLALLSLQSQNDLPKLIDVVQRLPDRLNLWVLYPKGSQELPQSLVMDTLKKLGLGPSKTAAIDDDTSSMRFARRKDT